MRIWAVCASSLAAAAVLFAAGQAGRAVPPRFTPSGAPIFEFDDRLTYFFRYEQVAPYPDADHARVFAAGASHDDEGRRLSAAEREEFERSIERVSGRDTPMPLPPGGARGLWIYADASFSPQHVFRYYDRDGRQVAEIAIAFCQGQARFTPRPVFDTPPKSWANIYLKSAAAFVDRLGLNSRAGCEARRA